MFHALPPSALDEIRTRLSALTKGKPPRATVAGLLNLGGGVAYRIHSPELEALRDDLAEHLHGLLSAQDQAGWRPHVTIQNKVEPKVARRLHAVLEAWFRAAAAGDPGARASRISWRAVGAARALAVPRPVLSRSKV